MKIHKFWKWFSNNADALRVQGADDIANTIEEQLVKLVPNGAVEVSKSSPEFEVIFSACGQKNYFLKIRELVTLAPKLPPFKFFALKPPRGFDFTFTMSTTKIIASDLWFEPLRAKNAPSWLGIRIYVPKAVIELPDLKTILLTVVETGIGEEAASEIAMLNCDLLVQKPKSALPITDLYGYIQWVKARGIVP